MANSDKRLLKRQAAAQSLGTSTVGVIGDGAFAAALAGLSVTADHTAVLWMRDEDKRHRMSRSRTHERLPGVSLSPKVFVTADPAELCALAEIIVLAVPTPDLPEVASALKGHLEQRHIVAHAIGGLAPGERRITEFLAAHLDFDRLAVLAGPALPAEIAHRHTSAVVVAAEAPEISLRVKQVMETAPLRVYRSEDVVGVELASALAGAITVVAGIADGLKLGNSPRAVLITRALTEAARVGAASGAGVQAFYGMAGLGTVLLRSSHGSRKYSSDYQLGLSLATGEMPPEWQTEGVRVLAAASRVSRLLDLSTPILRVVYQVVGRELSLDDAQDRLLSWVTDWE